MRTFCELWQEHLDLLQKVFPYQVFRNTNFTKSHGLNVYTGYKYSDREISNLVSVPKYVPFQQLWQSTGVITYMSLTNKLLNHFSNKASRVMYHTTGLVDYFIGTVLRRKYYDMKQADIKYFRWYCSIQIQTSGSEGSTN